MNSASLRHRAAACLLGLLAAFLSAPGAHAEEERKAFRVCEDPNNLPFSNDKQEGLENRIAELFAADLGLPLEYTWFPMRMGFIRNTLRARVPEGNRFKCDVVMGVPVGYELAATTKPYYRSIYAMAFVRGQGLDDLKTPADLLNLDPARLRKLKFAVFAQTPPVDWLLKYGLIGQAVFYQKQTGDPQDYPGEVIEKDLVAGRVDVAFVWGPIAGYFARKLVSPPIAVLPMSPEPGIQLEYSIAMGVRHGEREWKDRIEQLIDRNREKIAAILREYGVPVLPEPK